MNTESLASQFELLCVIVNVGSAKKIEKLAKESGITGCTICLGRGTIHNQFLTLLGMDEVKKEILIMLSTPQITNQALENINKKFHLDKPNHGIGFTISASKLIGASKCKCDSTESRGVSNIMYNAIFTVVERGKAEEVINAAVAAGSKGGTIINARGSGIHEHQTLFSMAIEPEKEVVMILSEVTLTDTISKSIQDTLQIDEPGNGILFILDINKAYGLY